jgi:hypothetical protein
MNLISFLYLDICDNHLYARDPDLRDFLENLQPGWEDCQTPPYSMPMPFIPPLLLQKKGSNLRLTVVEDFDIFSLHPGSEQGGGNDWTSDNKPRFSH